MRTFTGEFTSTSLSDDIVTSSCEINVEVTSSVIFLSTDDIRIYEYVRSIVIITVRDLP